MNTPFSLTCVADCAFYDHCRSQAENVSDPLREMSEGIAIGTMQEIEKLQDEVRELLPEGVQLEQLLEAWYSGVPLDISDELRTKTLELSVYEWNRKRIVESYQHYDDIDKEGQQELEKVAEDCPGPISRKRFYVVGATVVQCTNPASANTKYRTKKLNNDTAA
ncbi:MAG: hypothetical protein JWL85_725 [Candidatus Saccharibacteria bacterium]|nr:hypothetical protein [Candidatus Saccharibacteria bacterium]